jgi:branched-chain amino acid transport system permease protein
MGPYGLFLVTGLAVGAIYALSGVGLVVLYRATGVLNLAYGAFGAMGAMAAWQLMAWEYPEALAWAAAVAVATILSVAYGRFVAPHLSHREPVVKSMATLGCALVVLGLTNWLWIDTPRTLKLATDDIGFSLLGVRVTGTRALALAVAVLATVGIGLFLARTATGLRMRALANNRELSSVLGVPVRDVETVAWTISGVLAGFSGLIFGDLVRLNPNLLTFLVIPAIAATIVGRLDSLVLTLAGGMVLGVVESMLTLVTPIAPYRSAAPFIIAGLLVLWFQRHRRLTFSGQD